MEEFDELLEKLNDLNISQTRLDWEGNVPKDIFNKHFKGKYESVAYNLDVDTLRWHETSTSVIKICGGIMGINHITNIFSEDMDCEDCCHQMSFIKMKEVQVTSYAAK